nr:glycoside hydrolase family 16 protein [uncultured Lichenicoccus sp.]
MEEPLLAIMKAVLASAAGALKNILLAIILLIFSALPSAAQTKPLSLDGYRLVFNEDFKQLSVSSHGPGTTWTAHTPWHGDFGDAQFVDPQPEFPFERIGGAFRIEMRKNKAGKWESGLLASSDPSGAGFALQYGYFEMRAKLPTGPGTWPAFWLDSLIPKASTDPSVEIDVFEQYGKFPGAYNSTVTVWPKLSHQHNRSVMHTNQVPLGSLFTRYHTYGVEVGPQWTVFYLDRNETWRVPTPPEHRHGLMILADLGLGSGWPINHTPNPSYMYIDYIRAYTRPVTP